MENYKHSSTEQIQNQSENQRKYAKMTSQLKHLFIKKIIFQNKSIKEASQLLKINYSSAKAILSAHKQKSKVQKKMGKKNVIVSFFREIQQSQTLPIKQIHSSVGGLVLSSKIILPKTKIITKCSNLQSVH